VVPTRSIPSDTPGLQEISIWTTAASESSDLDERHLHILDVRLINEAGQQSVAVEFGDGRIRTLTAKELYEASRMFGKPETGPATAAQRRAEQLLSMRRTRR